MKGYRFFVAQTRRDTDRSLPHLRCALNCLSRPSLIAAYELELSVNDHLGRINVPAAKLGRVGALPFAVFMRRVGILPSDIIPIIYVFTENDQLRAVYRLGPVKPFEQ